MFIETQLVKGRAAKRGGARKGMGREGLDVHLANGTHFLDFMGTFAGLSPMLTKAKVN